MRSLWVPEGQIKAAKAGAKLFQTGGMPDKAISRDLSLNPPETFSPSNK